MTGELQGFLQSFGQLSIVEWIGLFAPVVILAIVALTGSTIDRRELIPTKTERILVVGGSSGIGRSIALQYAKRGASVAIMGRRQEELTAVRAECKQAGSPQTLTIVGDFSEVDAVLSGRDLVEKS
jgi:NADPH:quinone reductase-like Zn-dependent oxidoreductase